MIKIASRFWMSLLVLTVFFSCADYKLHYRDEVKAWNELQPPAEEMIRHSVYLIGDSGKSPLGGMSPALTMLKYHLGQASANSHVIFLGDNIYPSGVPPASEVEEAKYAKNHLDAQVRVLENYAGNPVFLPGNHDWRKYGVDGLARQERYLQEQLNKGIENEADWQRYFYPSGGCSGPEVLEVYDDLAFVLLDSQWWLYKWENEPKINQGCSIKSREEFSELFAQTIVEHKDKDLLIALHHPMYTHGTHGGNFSFWQHLFPLTEFKTKLVIPLPVLGTIAAIYRGTIGMRQDTANKHYKRLRKALVNVAEENGNYIFAGGHEHSLQFIQRRGQSFIGSGNGAKSTPVRLGKGSQFAYGGSFGFARLDYYNDGAIWVSYRVIDDAKTEGQEVYRQEVRAARD